MVFVFFVFFCPTKDMFNPAEFSYLSIVSVWPVEIKYKENWVSLLSTGTTFGNGSGRVEEAEEWKDITETSLDVMHFCLIDCLDATYCFLSPFCFGGGADASHSPFLTTTSRLAFSFTQQEPSGGSFDCKNSHWRSWVGGLIGLHLCIGTTMFHSRLLMRNWVRGGSTNVWRPHGESECAVCTLCCVYARVSAWWYFKVRSVKGEATDHMTALLICIINCWH